LRCENAYYLPTYGTYHTLSVSDSGRTLTITGSPVTKANVWKLGGLRYYQEYQSCFKCTDDGRWVGWIKQMVCLKYTSGSRCTKGCVTFRQGDAYIRANISYSKGAFLME